MSSNSFAPNGIGKATPLSVSYPVNSILELKLFPTDEVVRGLVFCTDEISQSIVLKKGLNHTTLASEIRVINVNCVKEKKVIIAQAPTNRSDKDGNMVREVALPLPSVTKKSIDEKEKRAIMMAEESFRHINQKASLEGQIVFDRLLKACNEVIWNGESIIVLNQIKVEPPYNEENCVLLQTGGPDRVLNEDSLERVKRIVGA